MAGVKTLADKRIKMAVLTVKPADLAAITVTELTAGIDASCLVAASNTRFSPSASETINDPAICEGANTPVYGASNYEGSLAPFWYLDAATGKYTAADNTLYEAVREKGSRVWVVLREGPEWDVAWAAGDEYEVYEVISDNPQRPTEAAGYIKRIVPVAVQAAELSGVVAAGI